MAKRITRTDSIAESDLFVLYKTSAGDYRGAPSDVLLAWLQANLTFPVYDGFREYKTQYATPTTTGFDVEVLPPTAGDNVHMILSPVVTLAAGTITFPPVASVIDKQEVLINATRQVTSMTFDANGAAAVSGAPSSFAADDFARFKFEVLGSTWFRVG